jgi:beta-galactosidase/beta-glucuronidase
MTFDIKTLKSLGFNMLRKHVKVEPALYYAAADELGILIMQDMPCLRPGHAPDEAQKIEFQRQLQLLITQFRSYSSIFAWVSTCKSPASAFVPMVNWLFENGSSA